MRLVPVSHARMFHRDAGLTAADGHAQLAVSVLDALSPDDDNHRRMAGELLAFDCTEPGTESTAVARLTGALFLVPELTRSAVGSPLSASTHRRSRAGLRARTVAPPPAVPLPITLIPPGGVRQNKGP